MTPWERKVWDSDSLTGFVVVLVTTVVSGALALLGWMIDRFGGFDWFRALWWMGR